MIVMMIGFGIVIPIMPFYIERFGAGGTELGMMMALFSIMQFIFSPFWGSLSDRYGRKKIMMIGTLGNAFSMVIIGVADSMGLIFFSRIIAGLFSAATMPTAMAYISDSTRPDERSAGMGVIGAAMGVGMVLGPGIGGWLSAIDLSFPFFMAALMSLVALATIWFILPESLAQAHRAASRGSFMDEIRKFRGPDMSMLWKELFGPLGFLMLLAFLVNFALANFEGVFALFADHAYGYSPAQVGSVFMVVGTIGSLVQMILTGPAARKFGEANVIKGSLLGSAIGFVLMALAPNNLLAPVAVGFFVFANAMLRPAIQSVTSLRARGGQGAALGVNNAYQSLGRVAGPLWAGALFDLHPYLPYLSGAVILLLVFAYSLHAMRARAEKPQPVPVIRQSD